jgi:hypothetical protein
VLNASAVFGHGACDVFAAALHDLTGWPLVKVTDPWNVHGTPDRFGIAEAGDGSAVHWVVRTPDGQLVDVHGMHPLAGFAEQFDAYVDLPDDEDELAGVEPGAKLGYATRDDAIEEAAAKGHDLGVADALPDAQALLARLP